MKQPPLRSLRDETLVQGKLASLDQLNTEDLVRSLEPGQEHCLKVRPDGTLLDGHHRIHLLRMRGVEVDSLPREVIERADTD